MDRREELEKIENIRVDAVIKFKEEIIRDLKVLLEVKGEVKPGDFYLKTPPSFDIYVNKSGPVKYTGVSLDKKSNELYLEDSKGALHTLSYCLKPHELVDLWDGLIQR